MALDAKKKETFWDFLDNKIEVLKIKVVGKDEISFNSKVDFVTDDFIEFTMNRVKGAIPAVYKKDKLDVVGTLNNGQQVLFYVKVRQIKLSDDSKKPSILVVDWPDNFVKKQMRQDVRVSASLKIYYSDQINDQNYFDKDKQYVGYLVDVSRGGGFIITNEKVIFKGKPFHLFLYINEGEHQLQTIIPCEVVVVKKVGSNKETKCQGMAFSFKNLSKKTEEVIVNWIFMCQRKQLASRKK
ncbi:MAG: PilZ domain-containing protein [Candidatus Cloacimonetes bacterium]|nr:PilZ domain-containing protein [Candidatus Cloacimonadota bacterium]